RDVRRNHPGAFEEVITELFYGLFADELRRATAARTISQAFLRDVETEIPKLAGRGSVIAEGLVAEVRLHGRTTEAVSGGDLGVLLVRPHVSLEWNVARVRDYRRGLLCQAKRRLGRRYEGVTPSQKQHRPEHI